MACTYTLQAAIKYKKYNFRAMLLRFRQFFFAFFSSFFMFCPGSRSTYGFRLCGNPWQPQTASTSFFRTAHFIRPSVATAYISSLLAEIDHSWRIRQEGKMRTSPPPPPLLWLIAFGVWCTWSAGDLGLVVACLPTYILPDTYRDQSWALAVFYYFLKNEKWCFLHFLSK